MEPTIEQTRSRLEAAERGSCAAPESVGELIERFMEHARSYYAPRKRCGTSEIINFQEATAPSVLLYADCSIRGFGPIQLRACRRWMIEQDLARSTVNARVRRLRHVFRWGVSMGWAHPEVLKSLEAVTGLRAGRSEAREPMPVKPISRSVFEATIAKLGPVTVIMSKFQMLTAMRPGEVTSIRGDEIDRSGKVWLYIPASHKTAHLGRQKIVPIGPKAIELIHTRLRHPYIFMTRAGGTYTTLSYGRAIARAAQRAGVEHWSPNQLRHTRLTEIRRLAGLDAAQAIAGHSRIETTQTYAEAQLQLAVKFASEYG